MYSRLTVRIYGDLPIPLSVRLFRYFVSPCCGSSKCFAPRFQQQGLLSTLNQKPQTPRKEGRRFANIARRLVEIMDASPHPAQSLGQKCSPEGRRLEDLQQTQRVSRPLHFDPSAWTAVIIAIVLVTYYRGLNKYPYYLGGLLIITIV